MCASPERQHRRRAEPPQQNVRDESGGCAASEDHRLTRLSGQSARAHYYRYGHAPPPVEPRGWSCSCWRRGRSPDALIGRRPAHGGQRTRVRRRFNSACGEKKHGIGAHYRKETGTKSCRLFSLGAAFPEILNAAAGTATAQTTAVSTVGSTSTTLFHLACNLQSPYHRYT